MKLCSHHLNFMVLAIMNILQPPLHSPRVIRIGLVDSTVLTLMALYMMNDLEAHAALQLDLQQRDPLVATAWNNVFDMTVLRNTELSEHDNLDVNELLRRLK